MRKIYLLKPRWIEWYFLLLGSMYWIFIFGRDEFDDIFVRISKFGYFELVFGILFTFGVPAIIMGAEWFYSGNGRELFHTIIDENGYQSCRFWKKFCYVDKGKDIYYAIYTYPYYRQTYIAFSNNPFKLYEFTWFSKKLFILSYIDTYDYRNVILLPYNEKTMLEFDIENWKKAECVPDGQYNWKTKTVEVRQEEE